MANSTTLTRLESQQVVRQRLAVAAAGHRLSRLDLRLDGSRSGNSASVEAVRRRWWRKVPTQRGGTLHPPDQATARPGA